MIRRMWMHVGASVLLMAGILLVVVMGILSESSEERVDCASYSVEDCPGGCVICPPCKACSSISCQSQEFCHGIGFERGWYESIKDGLNGSRAEGSIGPEGSLS